VEIFESHGAPLVSSVANFATSSGGVVDTGGKCLPVSKTPVANNGNNIRLLTTYSELEGKIFIYANSTTQRCPKEIMKTFLIEDFLQIANISANFQKTLNRPQWYNQGLGGN
jgi:hypothetical protein